MSNLRSSTTVFFADEQHCALISAMTSFIGWGTVTQGEEGIEMQAANINTFIKSDRVSGAILLIDENDGKVLHSAPFGAAFRRAQELAA